MTKELLPDNPPIEAGPIIIDGASWAAMEYDRHINYTDFVHGALSHGFSQNRADRSHRLTVEALVELLDLPILPPRQSVEEQGEEVWGPYSVRDYYIQQAAYLEYYDAITGYAAEEATDPEIPEVLQFVWRRADEEVTGDPERIAVEDLPGALYATFYPAAHLGAGHLVGYDDFKNATYDLQTSSRKSAAVFDAVVARLGNERAQRQIAELKVRGNPTDRKYIRGSLYVSTQALADFVRRLEDDPDHGPEFNALARLVLRNVLNGETV